MRKLILCHLRQNQGCKLAEDIWAESKHRSQTQGESNEVKHLWEVSSRDVVGLVAYSHNNRIERAEQNDESEGEQEAAHLARSPHSTPQRG